MINLAVVVLNFNGGNDTLTCFNSLQKTRKAESINFKIILVDNNSSDNSVKLVKDRYPDTIIIINKTNLGFSQGNNLGINFALKNNFDYILILNNDTLVDKNLFINLIETFKLDKNIGIVVPKIYFAPGFEYHKLRYKESDKGKVIWYAGGLIDWQNMLTSHRGVDEVDEGQYNRLSKADFATGCSMLIKKEVFKTIGLFDKKYFLYWEDVDFSLRAKKAGYKIYYQSKAIIWHKNASSSSVGSSLHDYYLTRNRLLFAYKYASLKTKISLLKESFSLLFNGRKEQKKGIIDFYRWHFGER